MNVGIMMGVACASLLALAYAYYRIGANKRLNEAQRSAELQKQEMLLIIEEHKKKEK